MALHGPAVRNGEPNGVAVEGPGMSHEPWIHDPGASDASGQRRKAPDDEDHDMTITGQRTVESIKREAKGISRATSITHSQALDVLAVQAGFSHWGAYQNTIENEIKLRESAFRDGTTPCALLSNVVKNWEWTNDLFPQTRHLIASGGAASGKTTIISRLAQSVPPGIMSIMCEADQDHVRGAGDIRTSTRHGTGPRGGYEEIDYAEALDEAVDLGARIIVFGDVTALNAQTIIKAMQLPHAPTVLATMNASSVEHAKEKWAGIGDARMIPSGSIMLLHMSRAIDGNRRISDIDHI